LKDYCKEMLPDSFTSFFSDLSLIKVLAYFWPFFLIDMSRYLLLDFVVILQYIPKRYKQRKLYSIARRNLFQERPLVSVIVPGKNEGQYIPRLAQSLALQTYPNIESIIVDDGSDDSTPFIGRRLKRQGKISQFIRNDIRGGKASAANTALRYCHGKYIVHLDADSYLAEDAIENILIPFYLDENVGAVGGDLRAANIDASLATRLQAIEYFKNISTGRTVSSELRILRIISGAFGAFRKDILDRIYGWDVGPGLDGDVTLKVRKLGYRVIHEPFAVCYTNVPATFRKLTKQRYRWDRSLIRFRIRKHYDILLPSGNFRWCNFFSSLDNIFFNLVLNLKWWVYIIQVLLIGRAYIEVIIIINLVLYGVANILEFGIASILLFRSMSLKEFALFLYLPLVPLYTGMFFRLVRTFAYVMELFFKVSFFDKWNPWKVSKIAKQNE